MDTTYFDVIMSETNYPSEEDFESFVSKGVYKWVLNSNLEKKIGRRIPGKDELYYNILDIEKDDYVLTINVDKKNINVVLQQATGTDVIGLTEIYSVNAKVKTVAEQLLFKSVPIPNFENYLVMAIGLKVKYDESKSIEVNLKEDDSEDEMQKINSQLSQLRDL